MRVELEQYLIWASEAYGELQARWYADHPSPRSTHGMQANPAKLALWRMCECAVCVALGLDPMAVLDWTESPDDGFDVPWLGLRFDVKGTAKGNRLLCYPATKVPLYDRHRFDLLVLVIADRPVFEIAGWRSKAVFKAMKRVADGPPLDHGTWFMDRDDLQPIERLLEIAGKRDAMGATGKGKEAVVFSGVSEHGSVLLPL